MAAHPKSMSSYRDDSGLRFGPLESGPNRCLEPAQADIPHFPDYPATGHQAEVPNRRKRPNRDIKLIASEAAGCHLFPRRPVAKW
jgi:hypothetical protein